MNNLHNCAHNPDGWCLDCVRAERLLYIAEMKEIEQVLGKALGYPYICSDQKNFPGSTEADGVCVGEHVPVTLAMEAAECIKEQGLQILSLKLNEHRRQT